MRLFLVACSLTAILVAAYKANAEVDAAPMTCELSTVTRAAVLQKYSELGVYCVSQGENPSERMSFFGDPAVQTFDEDFDCMQMKSGDRFDVTFMDERTFEGQNVTGCPPFKSFIERRENAILSMQDFE